MRFFNIFMFVLLLALLPLNIYYHTWHNSLACFAIGFSLRGQIPLLLIKKKQCVDLEQVKKNLTKIY